MFSSEQLADRVRDGLRKSVALETYWNRPITATQIDAEVRRMASGTRAPDRLRELWAALDDDPLLVAECLARPMLADRLIRDAYNFDERFRGPLRDDAVDALEGYGTVERQPDGVGQATSASDRVPFEQWWSETKSTLPALMGVVAGGSALPEIAEEGCTDDTWNPMRHVPTARDGHIAVWTGSEMIIWGGAFCEVESAIPGGRYDPATDSWTAINANNPPANRHGASGVWTGTEMIVWGGWGCSSSDNVENTGGRYNPTTDGVDADQHIGQRP